MIVGYISGLGEKTTKRAFLYSLTFAGGTACTFVALGLIATSVGHLLGTDSAIWHIILGLLMFLMALQIWDVINIIPETDVLEKNSRRGFVGAFLTGILAGIFASPCSTPILVALLAIIAGDGRFFWGILLMLCYAAGHSVLVLIAGHLRRFRAAPQRQRPLRALFILERKNPRCPHFCRWHLYALACSVKQNACAADDVSARRRLFILRLSY